MDCRSQQCSRLRPHRAGGEAGRLPATGAEDAGRAGMAITEVGTGDTASQERVSHRVSVNRFATLP